MKYLLTCIVLLSSAQYAYADTTLEFKELARKTLIIFDIKDGQIKLSQHGQKRLNIFNHKKQAFLSYDPKSGKKSVINEEVLNQRALQLNKKRLQKLAQVEKKLKERLTNMTQKEQETGESALNALKYPEMYGAHTRLSVKKLNIIKSIMGIDCQVYQLYRENTLLKDFCMANANALKIDANDYDTLRSFYSFNYNMQSRLMLAAGNTQFSLINYDKEKIPGINIESINYEDKKVTQHLILSRLNLKGNSTIKADVIKPNKSK